MNNPKDTVVPFVDLKRQNTGLKNEFLQAVERIVESAGFIRGPELAEFEKAFAEMHGAAHAIGVASGTDALILSVRTLGVGAGDEVITVPNSWISTAFSISHTGATPVFCDIDPNTHQMNPELLEKAISPRTKAVIPVHLYGHPAPMAAIEDVCKSKGIRIIEDVAQATLAKSDGRLAGTMGDSGCFSFYPSKNLGGLGDGGMVLANDDDFAARLRKIADYGQDRPHLHSEVGFNSRLDTLHAAILLTKLPHLPSWTEARKQAARWYDERLADLPVKRPATAPGADPVYHLYVIEVEERDRCLEYLRANGVMAQVHYNGIIHLQECYKDLGYKPGDFPVAERAQKRILSLPIFPEITEAQVDRVVQVLSEFLSQ